MNFIETEENIYEGGFTLEREIQLSNPHQPDKIHQGKRVTLSASGSNPGLSQDRDIDQDGIFDRVIEISSQPDKTQQGKSVTLSAPGSTSGHSQHRFTNQDGIFDRVIEISSQPDKTQQGKSVTLSAPGSTSGYFQNRDIDQDGIFDRVIEISSQPDKTQQGKSVTLSAPGSTSGHSQHRFTNQDGYFERVIEISNEPDKTQQGNSVALSAPGSTSGHSQRQNRSSIKYYFSSNAESGQSSNSNVSNVIDSSCNNFTEVAEVFDNPEFHCDETRHGIVVAPSNGATKRKLHTSHIWEHVERNVAKGSMKCKYCNRVLETLNSSNAKRHLKSCKPSIHEIVEKKDKVTSVGDNQPKQQKLNFSPFYQNNHPKQQLLRQKLALLYGSTSISANVIHTEEFVECLRVLDNRIKVPDCKTIIKDANNLVEDSIMKIRAMITTVKRLTIMSDIWTKKGMRASFLGVTATFFYPPLKEKVNVILGVQKFTTVTHKAEDIIREMQVVMRRYGIKSSQVWRALTDGGSNMICSHRADQRIFELQHEDIRNPEAQASTFHNESDTESESEDQFASNRVGCSTEINLHLEDETRPTYRRLTCFIHTTLVCLQQFDVQPLLKSVLDDVKKLVSKFTTSHKLTAALVAEAGVGLISFAETRWNYIYLVFQRLNRVKSSLQKVIMSYGKAKYNLNEEQWKQISRISEFLKPFHDYTNMISKEKDPVSSEVIVVILSMYGHLDKYDNDPLFGDAAKKIKLKLKQKFSNWFHEGPHFDPTYLIATLVDPRYRLVLPSAQRNLAKKYLIDEYNFMSPSNESDPIPTRTSVNAESSATSKYSLIRDMKEALLRAHSHPSTSPRFSLIEEIEKYLEDGNFDLLDDKCNVFQFWIDRYDEFPFLAPLALDFLSIPNSTSNVERVFGTSGSLTKGISNRLDGKHLENKVLLKKNKKLLEKLKALEAQDV